MRGRWGASAAPCGRVAVHVRGAVPVAGGGTRPGPRPLGGGAAAAAVQVGVAARGVLGPGRGGAPGSGGRLAARNDMLRFCLLRGRSSHEY